MTDGRGKQRRNQNRKEEKHWGRLGGLFAVFGALAGIFALRHATAGDEGGVLPEPESRWAGFELKDMRPRQVIFWLGLLVVAVTGLVIFIAIFERLMIGHLGNIQPVVSNPPNVQPPPAPQLETANGQVLSDIHAKEDQLLNNYTWIDKNAGTLRVPIDRAIELTAQRGLATLPQPTAAPGQAQNQAPGAGGQLTRPEESSSGRQLETVP